jgi:predicted RNase H-like nuclease (RuvC/YqgF family)
MERVATARTNVMAQNAEQKRLQGEYQTAARNLQTLSQEYGKVGADLNAAQANLQKINPVERWWGSKNYQQAQARVNELQTQMQSATMRLNQAYSQMQSLETQWNAAGGAVTPGSEFNVSMDDINQMGSQTNQSQGDPVLEEYMKNVMQEQ